MSFDSFWTAAIIILIIAIIIFWLGISIYRIYCFNSEVNFKGGAKPLPSYYIKCFFILIQTWGDGKFFINLIEISFLQILN